MLHPHLTASQRDTCTGYQGWGHVGANIAPREQTHLLIPPRNAGHQGLGGKEIREKKCTLSQQILVPLPAELLQHVYETAVANPMK